MFTTVITLVLAVWLMWMYFSDRLRVVRELGRFTEGRPEDLKEFKPKYGKFDRLLASVGNHTKQRWERKRRPTQADLSFRHKLHEAGIESAYDLGSFYLFRLSCYLAGPLVGGVNYLWATTYYATILLLMCSAVGILIPMLWLRSRTVRRTEDIQNELPLLIDLTNLGTSAGWDVASSLEKVIDQLSSELPKHPLLKEFKRARIITTTGYTWHEALERISTRMGNDAVRRCTLALGQAIRQGGDRTSQLEGIAEDAQRLYYAELDKRLAGLPVKAVLITMVLLISYFMILLAPAGVQIKNTVM